MEEYLIGEYLRMSEEEKSGIQTAILLGKHVSKKENALGVLLTEIEESETKKHFWVQDKVINQAIKDIYIEF
jgi:hypothetical protein